MKLLLFDIDGTLLSTHGAARRAFERALLDVYGTAGPIDDHDFAGKTDPQIARELLRLAGLADARIDDGLPRLWQGYLAGLADEMNSPDHRTGVMPGVPALLDELERRSDDALLALLTGNIEPGAVLKLESVGLERRFRFGAYGSDDERRGRLPAVALSRARDRAGRSFDAADAVIIGDTPYDVACGREAGMRVAGVATGPYTTEQLMTAGADVAWDTLADTAAVVDWLMGGADGSILPARTS